MSNKQKILFRISIAINILLVIVVAWGYLKMNFASEQLFFSEVQYNLVQLEGLIAHQVENDWSEPNLVTTKLGEVMNGLYVGIKTGGHLNAISSKDKQILNKLYYQLNTHYPHDELYSFNDVSEQDKEHLIELRGDLRDVGLGVNISISDNMGSFMGKVTALVEKIEVQQQME